MKQITGTYHPPIDILYLDNHLLVVNKPAGLLVQGDKSRDPSLLNIAKAFIKKEFDKPGDVFLGLVHRLDRPVSGVMVLARTSKAAGRLSEQFRSGNADKKYWALVEGSAEYENHLVNYLKKVPVKNYFKSKVVSKDKGQRAELKYSLRGFHKQVSWLEIDLLSGRHHQIRAQLAHAGTPILGDDRYGAKREFIDKALALHAYSLTIAHPTKKEKMTFTANPQIKWPMPFISKN